MSLNTPRWERAVFVGAGFSAGLHYPVGSELVASLIGYLKGALPKRRRPSGRFAASARASAARLESSKRILSKIDTFLRRYFSSSAENIQELNVAEFYSLAHSFAEMPGFLERNHLEDLYDDLACVTRTYFTDLYRANYQLPADIESLLDDIEAERDVIVNFNWDEEVDGYLSEDRDIQYTLGCCSNADEVLILRPHGSIGWYDVGRGIANKQTYFIAGEDARIPRFEKKLVAYYEVEFPRDLFNRAPLVMECPPVIMAPTFSKRFKYEEQRWIWGDVLEVCRHATQFVFLGYGLQQDDYLTRAAIRSALMDADPKRLRCLVVGRSFDDASFANFRGVFGSALSEDRNFLQWTFGQGGDLASRLERALARATVG